MMLLKTRVFFLIYKQTKKISMKALNKRKITMELYKFFPTQKDNYNFWQFMLFPTITIISHMECHGVLIEWLFWCFEIGVPKKYKKHGIKKSKTN